MNGSTSSSQPIPTSSKTSSRRRPRSAVGRTWSRTAGATALVCSLMGMPGGSSPSACGPLAVVEAFVIPSPSSHDAWHPVLFPSLYGQTGTSGTSHASSITTSTTALRMASSSDTLRTTSYPHLPSPPTPDEEVDLLTLAVEYLRLTRLERELALASPTLQPPRMSLRAEAAGYGDGSDDGEAVERYEQAMVDGQRARDELITRNMGLVHHVVNSIVGPDPRLTTHRNSKSGKTNQKIQPQLRLNSLTRDDLLQEGALGLSRAIDKYDPTGTNGARFATYAVHWIRASVYRCIAERDDLVRVPMYVSEGVKKLTQAAQALGIDLDEETTLRGVAGRQSSRAAWREAERAKMLAEEAGLSDRQLAEAVKVRRRRRGGGYTSLDGMEEGWQDIVMGWGAKRGGAATVTTTAAASAATSTGTAMAVTPSGHTTDDVAEIRRVLSEHLKPKELEALSWRYGLNRATDDPIALAAAKTATRTTKTKATPARDYEEEALEDLFGREGLLASYSADPLPSTARAIQSERSAKKKAATAAKARTSSAPRTTTGLVQGGRWGEAMSFAEVGRHMAVSAEYGRVLCGQALKKLQVAADEGRLEFQPDWLSV